MKVKLINATSDAVNLLLFTKNTRLMNDEDAYEKVSQWDDEKKQAELDYMLQTIRSSWEFIRGSSGYTRLMHNQKGMKA